MSIDDRLDEMMIRGVAFAIGLIIAYSVVTLVGWILKKLADQPFVMATAVRTRELEQAAKDQRAFLKDTMANQEPQDITYTTEDDLNEFELEARTPKTVTLYVNTGDVMWPLAATSHELQGVINTLSEVLDDMRIYESGQQIEVETSEEEDDDEEGEEEDEDEELDDAEAEGSTETGNTDRPEGSAK
jgi:hypothetical protein